MANIISKLGINEDLKHIRLESPEINFKDVIINIDTYPVCKKEDSLQVQRNCLLNTLSEKYPSFQQYYTDGSKIGEKVGYSVLSKETGITITGRLEEGVSVFDAQMTAIEKALRMIHGECTQNSKAVVLSDSRSAIAAIKGNGHKSVMGIYEEFKKCQEKAITVGLQWCPSHCDIDGNEKADKLAKEATLLGSISSECTNFYSKYRRITWLLKKSEINRNLEKSSNRYVEYFKGKTPNKKYIPITRKAANIIFRLRTQHAATNEHLKKLNLSETNMCDCASDIQSIRHLLEECHITGNLRSAVKQICDSLNFSYGEVPILFPPQSTSHYATLINKIGNVLSASNLAWI